MMFLFFHIFFQFVAREEKRIQSSLNHHRLNISFFPVLLLPVLFPYFVSSDPNDAGEGSSRDTRTAAGDVLSGDGDGGTERVSTSPHLSVNDHNVIRRRGNNDSGEETIASMDDENNGQDSSGRPAPAVREVFSLQSQNRQALLGRAKRKTLRMSILIVATFVICEYIFSLDQASLQPFLQM